MDAGNGRGLLLLYITTLMAIIILIPFTLLQRTFIYAILLD